MRALQTIQPDLMNNRPFGQKNQSQNQTPGRPISFMIFQGVRVGGDLVQSLQFSAGRMRGDSVMVLTLVL